MIAALLSAITGLAAGAAVVVIHAHRTRAQHRRDAIVGLLATREPKGLPALQLAEQLGRGLDHQLYDDLDTLEEQEQIDYVLEPSGHPRLPLRTRYVITSQGREAAAQRCGPDRP